MRFRTFTGCAVLGFLLAFTAGNGAAVAQSSETGAGETSQRMPSASAPPVTDTAGIPLSLNEAIRRAIENNNEIAVARADVGIARSSLQSVKGIYDPILTFSPRYSNNKQPQPSTLGGADLSGVTRSNEFRFDSSLRQSVRRTGGDFSVGFNNSRQETSSLFSQLNPTFNSTLGLTYTQPLLRNRAIDSGRRQLIIQDKRIGQSEAEFQRRATDVVNRVQRAYWDLVFALGDRRNKLANLELSKENLRQIEARIAAGAAAPLQKAEIMTELANRESEVLVATQQVGAAENALKQLMLGDAAAPEWGRSIEPTDRPAFSDEAFDLQGAVSEAVAKRHELKRLRIEKEISDVEIKFRRDQVKPQVDLTTGYTLIGLSGSLVGSTGAVPPRFVGGFGQALDNLSAGETRSATLGLTISLPLRNRTAKADLATAELQRDQVDAQLRSQEQAILAEVRNAVQAAETARQRVMSARKGRESAEVQLDGERKLFDVGRSTQFLLFQRENALTNARNAEVRAETDYSKAIADLQRVTSTTLEKNGITIKED